MKLLRSSILGLMLLLPLNIFATGPLVPPDPWCSCPPSNPWNCPPPPGCGPGGAGTDVAKATYPQSITDNRFLINLFFSLYRFI
jgi:hypothetical protein